MNSLLSNLEIAAPRGSGKKTPAERLPSAFLSLCTLANALAYAMYTVVSTGPLTQNTKDAKQRRGDVVSNRYMTRSLTAEKMRELLLCKPGTGKNAMQAVYKNPNPSFGLTEAEADALVELYGANRSALVSVAQKLSGYSLDSEANADLESALSDATNPNSGFGAYKGVLVVTFKAEKKPDDVEEGMFIVDTQVSLEISPVMYSILVDSDEFSPYLVNLAILNMLDRTTRAVKIVDPRKTSALTRQIGAQFGTVKPRVNKEGFSVFENGLPIAIPANTDMVDRIMSVGNSSIDAEGFFDDNKIIENNLHNSIIYVDWLNDVLAYTTPRGKIATMSLVGTSALTPEIEYSYLQTPLNDPRLKYQFLSINNSLSDVSLQNVMQYIPKEIQPQMTFDFDISASDCYLALSSERFDGNYVTLGNIAGDTVPTDNQKIIGLAALYRAYLTWLYHERHKDQNALRIQPEYASQGIRFRIIGTDYLLHIAAKYSGEKIEMFRREWAAEEDKKRVDLTKREFELSNIAIGSHGIQGLLPHQGRIVSSMEKIPKIMMLPVPTGGGKTSLSFIRALTALMKIPNIRVMISTKGNLVKGTITEINTMSQGKINVVPLRMSTLRRLKGYGIDTTKKLMQWIEKFPPNTIFINGFTDYSSRGRIYDDLPSIYGFANRAILDSQYLRIIRLIGFDMIIADESHMIKNPSSKRSRGAYSAMCSAEYRTLMSGTMASNTVADLVGQANGATPVMFGSNVDAFCAQYNIPKGIIKDDATARILKERMTTYAAYLPARKDEWSYMLPNKDDQILRAQLTPKQADFYNKLLLELMNQIQLDMESTSSSDEDEDDDEDDDEDAEDAEENKFIAKAKIALQRVEQFLSAPDEDEEFVASGATGSDLVSPKIAIIDSILERKLAEGKDDPGKSKVIIFAINKSAVRHVSRHSRFASQMLVYFAGDQDVLRRYKDEDNKRILLAAETSLREGENLQMTRTIIKLQPPWAPGDYEQAIARMFRPDPRGKFNRDLVEHFVILASKPDNSPTLDTCKMARLVSKFISNARLTYVDDPDWNKTSEQFDSVGLLRMNPKLILSSTTEDLAPYFDNWHTFNEFENRINTKRRIEVAKNIEASTGIRLLNDNNRIVDVQKFISLAMYDVRNAPVIPGSKNVYAPWVPGSLPPDPDGFGFQTLGSEPIRVGDVVWTELGPGIVQKFSDTSVNVALYGKRSRGFNRMLVCTVSEHAEPIVRSIIKDGRKWQAYSRDPFGKIGVTTVTTNTTTLIGNEPKPVPPPRPTTTSPVKPLTPPKPVKEVEPVKEPEAPALDINVSMINGFPALVILNPDGEDYDVLHKLGWNRVDPFVSVSFKNWSDVDQFLDELDNLCYVYPKTMNTLEQEITQFKTGRSVRLNQPVPEKNVRQFFADQRRKYGQKNGKIVVNPYFIAIEREIRLAFDADSHMPKFINWLLTKAKRSIPGIKQVRKTDSIYIKTFSKISDARKYLSQLVGKVDFDQADLSHELTLLADEIKELQVARKRPI